MSSQKGYYSLVQFCPDPSRLEGVNIGVVLFSPEDGQLKVQITRNNKRIRRFFGEQDWEFVKRAKKSVENHLRIQNFSSLPDLQSYISRRANVIQISPPRPMRIVDIEGDMAGLYDRLIGRDLEEQKPRVNGYLTQRLREAGVADLVRKSVSIKIPGVNQSIHVPYGYKNGRFNLISPVQFDANFERVIEKTGKSVLESQLLSDHPDPEFGQMHLVVVANFDEQITSSTRNFVCTTLQASPLTFYSFENFHLLVDDIRRSAAAHS